MNVKQKLTSEENIEWTLADLIDFEILLDEDTKTDYTELSERDGDIRRELITGLSDAECNARQQDTPENRRRWLHQWLQVRKKQTDAGEDSAGSVTASSLHMLGGVLALLGGILGLISALGILAAPRAIYIPWALLVYLGPQLFLLIIALWSFTKQRFGWSISIPLIIRILMSKILRPILSWVQSRSDESQEHEIKSSRIKAATGLVMSRGKLRREALGWPLLSMLQKAGTSFAFWVIIGIFVVCLGSPRNFGWGSTMKQVDADVIHKATQTLSAPWRWALNEGTGAPTLEEVRTSQISRDQPLSEEFPRLSSWWAFLCLSLLTYTLFPRLVLLCYSLWRGNRALREEMFSDSRSDRLFRRLAKPRLVTSAPSSQDTLLPEDMQSAIPDTVTREAKTETMTITSEVMKNHCTVLTELELTSKQTKAITERIEQLLGLGVSSYNRTYSIKEQEDCLARLSGIQWEDRVPRVCFLYRSSDPIVANLRHLVEQCFKAIGNEGQVTFVLLGERDILEGHISQKNLEVWKEYANKLKLNYPNTEIATLTSIES